MFLSAGFDPVDVNMSDIAEGYSLASIRGIAPVGGFSFRDVLGAAVGWSGMIRFNENIRREFEAFRARPETFGLGICNGAQVFGELEWVAGRFRRNKSQIFESRFPTLRVMDSDIMFFKNMAGSQLGSWLAHGEGCFETSPQVMQKILVEGLAPLRYIDPWGEITEEYPFNPNGSPHGIAAVASYDKRFVAMMPHAERTGNLWNWPWAPDHIQKIGTSPWFKIFTNARAWCEQ
jgi:phosphoribosylformylglycinamidine synthase